MACRPDFDSIRRIDPGLALHRDADGESVKENARSRGLQEIVGGELERRRVVGLRHDLAATGRVHGGEAFEAIDPRQQIVDDAVNDLTMLDTVNFRVQAAEIAQPRHSAGSAKEAIPLHQQRRVSLAGGGYRCGDSSRAAANHDDIVFVADRRFSAALDDDAADGTLHYRNRLRTYAAAALPFGCTSAV
jgi:hypothetical protein